MFKAAFSFLILILSWSTCVLSQREKVRCVNLTPYEPVLNSLIDAIPGRAIQDSIPLPIKVNDGGEVYSLTIDTWFCNLDLSFDNLVLQVINTNFVKMSIEVLDRESVYLSLPFTVTGTIRIAASCLLYKPKIFNQIEFSATFTPRADVCIDILGIGDLPNILNYTYATVSDINYKAEAQNMYWCIYDALPLLESIIDDALEENVDKIWAAVDKALNEAILPGMEKAINSVLRAIGIKPYNETVVNEDLIKMPKMMKPAPRRSLEKLSVITTNNFTFMYNDKGTGAWMDATFFRPTTVNGGYYPLGDFGQRNYNSAFGTAQMVLDDGGILTAKPVDYQRVWESRILFSDHDGSFWRPIPPSGYVALGHVVQKGYNKPSLDTIRVIREDCVVRCDPNLLWTDRCSKASDDVGTWSIAETTSTPIPGTFISVSNYERPANDLLYCLNPECL